jgi:hypothetical protein
MRTGGSENQRYTLMLCIMVDGRKLPLYVILKRKTVPIMNVKRIFIRAKEKGWMNISPVLDWIM